MKGPKYYCSLCFQGFTRKNNGKRHNDNLHDSQASIIPLGKIRSAPTRGTTRNTKLGFIYPMTGQNKEELLSETLNRIGIEFEDCEQELKLHSISSEDRARCLATIVIHSLTCENPQEPLRRYLKAIRKYRLNMKIIRCVAAGLNITPIAAKQLLISVLEQSE